MYSPEEFQGERCVVRRVLSAPVGRVFHAWTDPEMLSKWSYGSAYVTVSLEVEHRVGGRIRHHIRDRTTGENWFFEGEYREITPDRRLVHTFHFKSDRGEDDGLSLVMIDFLSAGESTEVVITHTGLADEKKARGTIAGWEDILTVIDGLLTG